MQWGFSDKASRYAELLEPASAAGVQKTAMKARAGKDVSLEHLTVGRSCPVTL